MDWIDEKLAYMGDGDLMQEEVGVFHNMVQHFMLCANLLWAVWAVIQAEKSNIDCDFVDSALQRFREYIRWKSI